VGGLEEGNEPKMSAKASLGLLLGGGDAAAGAFIPPVIDAPAGRPPREVGERGCCPKELEESGCWLKRAGEAMAGAAMAGANGAPIEKLAGEA